MRGLIIAISVMVIIATSLTIIIGARSFEGIVVEKPYETGLAWDAEHHHKEHLGWSVAVASGPYHIGKQELSFRVLDKSNAPLSQASVSVKVTRPETTAYDKIYAAEYRNDGAFHAAGDLPLQGNWDLLIMIKQANDQTTFTNRIFVEKNAK